MTHNNAYSLIFGGGLDDCPTDTKGFLQDNYDLAAEFMERQGSPPPFAGGPLLDSAYTSELYQILEENNMDYLKDWLPQSDVTPPVTPFSPVSSCSSTRNNSLADTDFEVEIDSDEEEDQIFADEEDDPEWISPKPVKRRTSSKVNKLKQRRSSAGSTASSSGDDEDFVVPGRRKRRRRRFSSGSSASEAMPKAKITVWLAKLLNSPAHNPRVLQWENREKKVFRINDQEELARLWGEAKSNPDMTYEKFSRAMRYYYSREELVIVRRKLIYRFGPRAAIWRS